MILIPVICMFLAMGIVNASALTLESEQEREYNSDLQTEYYTETDSYEENIPDPVPENALRFEKLIARNSDFAAWLKIPGTEISYPVMSSPEEDYYLHRNFDREESRSGTPYMAKGCDTESDNILIYGHNMKNGTMFADLLKYEDESFFIQNPTISFDTVEKSSDYRILAVFFEQIHYQDEENVFRYYDYSGRLTKKQFEEYINAIKKISLYDTGNNTEYGNQLITLSTCSHHTENGRFVVVAAEENET